MAERVAVLEAEERAEAGWVGVMEEAEKVEGEKAEVEKVVEGMVEARAVEREAVMVAAVWEVARAEKVVEAMVEARAVEREAVMVAARAVALATSVVVAVGASAVVTGVLTVDRVETGLEMLEVVLVVNMVEGERAREADWRGVETVESVATVVLAVVTAARMVEEKVGEVVAPVALGVEREAVEKVVAMGVGMVHAVCLAGMSSRSIDS